MNLDRLHLGRRTSTEADTAPRTGTDTVRTERISTRSRTSDAGTSRTGATLAGTDREVVDRERADRADRDRDRADRGRADRDRFDDRADRDPAATTLIDRRAVVARQREAFGGVKIGSAFFGWLTATGTAVLLTAFIAAGGTAAGVLGGGDATRPDFSVTWRGARGAAMIVLILFVAYFCGGYVAGRMARFNGLKQGLAVFGWAVVVALLVAAVGSLAGTEWDSLSALTGLPRFSTEPTRITTDGMLVGLLALLAALVGAMLGGLAGMRFHRRVDRAGLGQ